MPELLVFGQDVHGMPSEDYRASLQSELEDWSVTTARTSGEIRERLPSATAVTGARLTTEQLEQATALELFACTYAGTDHLPVDELADHGVVVTNASGVHAPNVAEHALGAILSFARRFHVARRRQDRGEWRHFRAHELADSTVTVVGLGAIGEAICERLEPFDVEVIGIRHSPEKGGPATEVHGYEAVEAAFARSDYVVLACPLTDETRGLVDEHALRTMPSRAVIVNVARGPVVETPALVRALQRGHLRGAALDVTDPEPLPEDHPLWSLGNVLVTPHNAGHTPRYYDRRAAILSDNLERLARGDPLRNVIVDGRR